MPGFDGTGPRGNRFGRGFGPCGSGLRRRNRFLNCFNFWGRRSPVVESVDQKDETLFLKEQLQELEEEKKNLIQKIERLEKE